jgi:hypothetical protein
MTERAIDGMPQYRSQLISSTAVLPMRLTDGRRVDDDMHTINHDRAAL